MPNAYCLLFGPRLPKDESYFATAIVAFMLGWYLQWYLIGPDLIAAE